MTDLLFVHNNFPAQFGFLADMLRRVGHRYAAIGSGTARATGDMPLARWQLDRGSTPGLFAPATRAEADLLRGAAAAQAALALKERGFSPALIIGHPGWGETVYLSEVFPNARQILYGEFYYRTAGGDVGFDPEFGAPSFGERLRILGKNATGTLAYADADSIVSPTRFQGALLPAIYQGRVTIIHEGVDVERVAPRAPAAVTLASGRTLALDRPIVTFVNRRFEPMRGFHTFMRALPAFLARVPEAEIVLIGADDPGVYGQRLPDGTTWKAKMLAEVGDQLDLSRLHFVGTVPHAEMLALLSLSAAHVYLTYPFALSWSFLEAMALGCLVVGSRTAPVEEVIEHGRNGLLVDFFDPAALAETLVEACTRGRAASERMRQAARQTVLERYDRRRVSEPAWLQVIEATLEG